VSECSFADSECGKNTNYETKKAAAAAELAMHNVSLGNFKSGCNNGIGYQHNNNNKHTYCIAYNRDGLCTE